MWWAKVHEKVDPYKFACMLSDEQSQRKKINLSYTWVAFNAQNTEHFHTFSCPCFECHYQLAWVLTKLFLCYRWQLLIIMHRYTRNMISIFSTSGKVWELEPFIYFQDGENVVQIDPILIQFYSKSFLYVMIIIFSGVICSKGYLESQNQISSYAEIPLTYWLTR